METDKDWYNFDALHAHHGGRDCTDRRHGLLGTSCIHGVDCDKETELNLE